MSSLEQLLEPRLKQEVSATELVAAATAAATALSTVYNWAYFAPVDNSFVALLSLQDLLIGAAIALVPASLALFWAGIFVPLVPGVPLTAEDFEQRRRNKKRKEAAKAVDENLQVEPETIEQLTRTVERLVQRVRNSIVALVLTSAVSFFAIWIWQIAAPRWHPEYLPFAAFFASALVYASLGLREVIEPKRLSVVTRLLVMSTLLLVVVYCIGRSEYYKSTVYELDKISEVTVKGQPDPMRAKIVRTTSNFVFMLQPETIVALPLDRIDSVATPSNYRPARMSVP